jgi:hypothetical protein
MQFSAAAPLTVSSHTGSKLDKVYRDSLKDMNASIILPPSFLGAVLPTDVNAPSRPNEVLSMRGSQITPMSQTQAPSNLMAGTPAPPPLSGAPQAPGGNLTPMTPSPMGGISSGITSTGKPMPPPIKQSTGIPLKGTLKMTIPFDVNKKPLFSQIKDIFFIPTNPGPVPPVLASTAQTPVTMVAGARPPVTPVKQQTGAVPASPAAPAPKQALAPPAPQTPKQALAPPAPQTPKQALAPPAPQTPAKLPPPVPPQAIMLGKKKVRTYPDGRQVVMRRGQSITTYPNGQKVIMRRGPMGRMITTTVKPDGSRVIQRGRKTITVQPNGSRVIVTRGIFGTTTKVVQGPRRR